MVQHRDMDTFPSWARSEFRNKQATLRQILQRIVQLNANIGDLETMLNLEQYPRSIQVNVSVSVSEAQQHAMDVTLQNAKKVFQTTVLQALIHARKAELQTLKTQANKMSENFQTFLADSFKALVDNDVPLPEEDHDTQASIQACMNVFQKASEEINIEIQTKSFFRQRQAQKKKQERAAAVQQSRINEELNDPHIKQLQSRIASLEKRINSNSRDGPDRPSPRFRRPKFDGKSQHTSRRPTRQDYGGNKSKNWNPQQDYTSLRNTRIDRDGNQNQDRDQGYRTARRRYTKKTPRSGSRQRKPPNWQN